MLGRIFQYGLIKIRTHQRRIVGGKREHSQRSGALQ
ncbi:MAG: hypothetical protein RIR79_1552, partial [Pseudomonadota bacterium]|jgi:hypothetical protein